MNFSTDIFTPFHLLGEMKEIRFSALERATLFSLLSLLQDSLLLDSSFISVMQRMKSKVYLSIAIHGNFSCLFFLSGICIGLSTAHAKNSAVSMAAKHRTCCSQACLPPYYDSLVRTSHLFAVLYLAKSVIFIISLKGFSLFLVLSIFSHGSSMDSTSLISGVPLYS